MKKRFYDVYPYPNLGKVVDGILYILDYVEYYIERPVKKVLDIGCGTGEYAIAAGRRYPEMEIIGLDYSSKAIEIANKLLKKEKNNNNNVNFICEDFLNYKPKEKFDYIICSGLIEETHWIRGFFNCIALKKLLKHDGMIGVNVRANYGIGEDVNVLKKIVDKLIKPGIDSIENKLEITKNIWNSVHEEHWLRKLISSDLIKSDTHLGALFVSDYFEIKDLFFMLDDLKSDYLKFVRFADEHLWIPEFFNLQFSKTITKKDMYELIAMIRRDIPCFEFFASPVLKEKDWKKDKLMTSPFGAIVENKFIFFDNTVFKFDGKRIMILKFLKESHTLDEIILEIREVEPIVITEFVEMMFKHKVLI